MLVCYTAETRIVLSEETALKIESSSSLNAPVNPTVPSVPTAAAVTTSDRDISRVRSVLDSMVSKLKIQIDTTEKVCILR